MLGPAPLGRMSAYGAGADFLRLFESKRRAVSATRRKAVEEATAALDVDTDPPLQHIEGHQAPVMTWYDPPLENFSFGNSTVSGAASEHSSTRAANSLVGVRPRRADGLAQARMAPVSFSNGRLAGISAKQQQDRFSPPCHATMFASRIGSGASTAAAGDADAADRFFSVSDPSCVAETGAHSSLRNLSRRPPSAHPPMVDFVDCGGCRGRGEAPFRVPSIRTTLRDSAGVAGTACNSSPVEHVVARRKRRRRANFGVSSALLFSASTEEVMLPPMPEPRPLVTEEDDEHAGTAVPGLCDALQSLDLSRTSCDSSGSWQSNAASGFELKLKPFEGAGDVTEALNADLISTSRTDHELDDKRNGDRDGFAAPLPARSGHRVGVPLEEPREETLRQVGVNATSCGGVGYTQGDETGLHARSKQGKLGPLEGCRNDSSTDEDVDRCWKRVPLKEGTGKPNAAAGVALSCGSDQDVPPSPLPSPPVPLSPTARRETQTIRRLPPSRVRPAWSHALQQQCQEDCHRLGAPDSKHNSLCTELNSTFGIVDEATTAMSQTAKKERSGNDEIPSPPEEEPLFQGCTQGSIMSVREHSGMTRGLDGQALRTGSGRPLQPQLGDRAGPPRTVLLQDIAAPATGVVSQEVQCQLGASLSPPTSSKKNSFSCDGCEASSSLSPSAPKALSAPDFCGEAEMRAKALREAAHDGVRMAVSSSPPTRTSHEASPWVDGNPRQQARLLKATAVLILQRWVRGAILRRESTSGLKGEAEQRMRELVEATDVERPQRAKYFLSSPRHHPGGAHEEDAVQAHAGVSLNETKGICQDEAGSLLPEAETPARDAAPPYWRDDPIHDQGRALPRNGLVVASADRNTLGKTPVSSSQAFGESDDLSHDRAVDEPGCVAERSTAQRRRGESCQGDEDIEPPHLPEQEEAVGIDQIQPEAPSSTVLLSVIGVSPPLSVSLPLGVSSSLAPRLKPDDLPPSERESRTRLDGSPASGGGDCDRTGVRGQCAISSSASRQGLVARGEPCDYSFEALGKLCAPADVGFKAGNGYHLTVQEACLRPPSCSSKGGRAPCGLRSSPVAANDRDSCHPGAIASTAAVIPVGEQSASIYRQVDNSFALISRAFARQGHMSQGGDDVGGNPLLGAWGVGNPLLTRLPGTISAASERGGAPYH